MAKLKIYNSIEDKDTKTIMEGWFGIESTCYEDIKDFIEQIPADDDIIDIYLHCPGGNCIEGWAMYDALRTSGKKITTVVDGLCASMGTVLMMAAPKERRLAQKNATILIHNPYCVDYFQYEEIAHADELDAMANKVRIQAEEMREMQEKILNLYVERTGSDKDELQALMNEDRCIGTDKALELGLIGGVLEPNTDKFHSKHNKMTEITVKASVLDRMLAKLGLKSLDEMKCQTITDVTGAEITIDSDDDPAVGDTASPDGVFTMDDGSVLTISGGVITSIDKKSEEEREDGEDDDDEDDEKEKDDKLANAEQLDELHAQIDTLQSQVDELNVNNKSLADANMALAEENENLKASNKELSDNVELLTSQVRTEEDVEILNKINALGGMAWLEMAEKVSSSYRPDNGNQFSEHRNEHSDENETIGAGYLAAKRAKRHHM